MPFAANIVEIFSSIQGEGKYVGCRQLFVRFAGCNASCKYCDTADSRKPALVAKVEGHSDLRDFITVPNPIPAERLLEYIIQLYNNKHHSISLTGGEPLCHADMLYWLLPRIKGVKYLETNGTLPKELARVLPYVDIISMDIKLPSVAGTNYWAEHRDFLRLASEREMFVKIVISGETTDCEFNTAIQLIADVDRGTTVILQPVTPINGCASVAPARVLLLQNEALNLLNDVRVIPQTHKYIGLL
ncbi:7-carboxy-7-deazaguanine synthase [bioreactor metagenome]|uniref:7-carboxy-7-deazaguanine synthase n=1 Tax=bioreactor metagenome TaxID=1076179 RepID=A0A644T3N7_9ZZZZ